MRWTDEKRNIFVTWLQNNPCMYVVCSNGKKDQKARRQAISEICGLINIDSADVMAKIRSLRTVVGNKKRNYAIARAKKVKKYGNIAQSAKGEFYGDLQFLADHVFIRSPSTSPLDPNHAVESCDITENDSCCQCWSMFPTRIQPKTNRPFNLLGNSPTPVPIPKSVLDIGYQPQYSTASFDSDYQFLIYLLATFQVIKCHQIRGKLKSQMLELVIEELCDKSNQISWPDREMLSIYAKTLENSIQAQYEIN